MEMGAGLRLASEETLSPTPSGDLRGIAVRVSVNGPWRGLVTLLRDLALADIPMIADDIQLRGLTGAAVPMKVYRGRERGANVPMQPVHRYTGDMRDTTALEAWIATLQD